MAKIERIVWGIAAPRQCGSVRLGDRWILSMRYGRRLIPDPDFSRKNTVAMLCSDQRGETPIKLKVTIEEV